MRQLEILADRFDASVEALPEIRREALERAGRGLLSTVRGRTGGTGKVQSWQELHMGSRGGYAAVRPKAGTFYRGYAAGYVTNAIENGHRTRSGGRAAGKHMYLRSQADAVLLQNAARDEIVRCLAERLED